MSESMGELPRKIKDKFLKISMKRFSVDVVPEFNKGGWRSVRDNIVTKHMKNLGFVSKFITADQPDFEQMRRRLNTKPGVIICNHPGMSETPIILSVLEREDLKVMISKEVYAALPEEVAQKYFFSANEDPKNMAIVFRGINDHIKNGGVLLIYPKLRSSASFERGFRIILQKILKPEDMIYCFNVNTTDTSNLASRHPWIGIGSEFFLHPITNINTLREPITIRTDEAYTQAGEWQKAIEGVPKNEADKTLTLKYESMFASNK
jgi:hypothetical protein